MTPYQITILLHYASSLDDYPRNGAPIHNATVDNFVIQGLLELTAEHRPTYKATSKLMAYSAALQDVPLPVSVWVIPDRPCSLNGQNPYTHEWTAEQINDLHKLGFIDD